MKHKTKKLIYNFIVVVLIAVGLVWVVKRFVHLGRVEYTDNAQVKQLIVPVNSRIQGFIREVRFEDFARVRKGDTLLIIEDTEYRFRLAQARADYANAQAGRTAMTATINTAANNIAVTEAGLTEARVRMENAEREMVRYSNLYAGEAVTKQQYEAVKTEYEAMKARYEMLQRQSKSTTLIRDEQRERLDQTEAAIALAATAVDLAELNLSYTVITAPCDGTTGRKNVQAGQLLQPGQTIVDIVSDDERWVVANYKETQTAHIAEGMEVEIEVDAVPGVRFRGVVKAVSGATGASFSLLPQDNSAGNFVKIEQRIPVRIDFTPDNTQQDLFRLRAGMNAECNVKY